MFLSLPVSVKNSHPLGYWLTPILVDAFSKQTGEGGLFCYGKLGLRAPSSEEEVRFHNNLDFLNITAERITDSALARDLYTLALQAYNSDRLISRTQESFVCPCGVLSIPVAIVEYTKNKAFKQVDNTIICRSCNQEAKISWVTGLYYTVKKETALKQVGLFPRLYSKEVASLVRQIHDQGIPVSRARPTGFTLENWNLDIEFLWSLLPLTIRNITNKRIRLVVTNEVLRQAVTTYILAAELDPEFQADLVICPIVAHPGKIEKWNLDRLRSLGYDGSLLRFILLSSLGWNQKEANLNDLASSVEYRRFNLLRQLATSAGGMAYEIQEAMRNLSQQNLVSGLSNVFNPERFDYKTLNGLF